MTVLWDAYRNALPSIAAAVGRTPLVKLNRVTAGVRPAVYLKVEWYGPSGSLKDRIYLWMFERAEARGDLKPGMRVLECSTGNAGIACAFVSAVKGYPCTIVMPEGMSEERKKIMRAYGAKLIFTPGGESDVDLALAALAEIRAGAPDRYWVPGQFDNAANVAAAIKLAQRHTDFGAILTPINDTGQRYFSTPLCDTEKHVEIPDRAHPIDARSDREIRAYYDRWEIIG